MHQKLLLSLLSWIIFFPAFSQVQSPTEFLGYEPGERFTRHHRIMEYFAHVAENSDRVNWQAYGETYEHRTLSLAFVSSPNHLANLEEIRQDNLKRARVVSGNPAQQIGIVWLSYNVHGNESVSSEAAMKTLYELISSKSDWLENTLVIIDPSLNPDGRDRYVNFYNSYGNKPYNPDIQSKEHREPWPSGRPNHYLFDLNRDWAWITQVESQQRIQVYNSWLPHIHVDFHEQGINSPYYFAPAAEPNHELITPWQKEFQEIIGKNHAQYFDKEGWEYFTRELFDLLYPSYGDTYPTYSGAIGMTYEKGGSGRAGLGVETRLGDTLTLKERILHHHTTGLSTVEVAHKNNQRMLTEFDKYYQNALNNSQGVYKSYVIRKDNHPDKILSLLKWLEKHQIAYGKLGQNRSGSAYSYQSGKSERVNFDSEDIVISALQPKSVFIQVLFDPQPKLTDSITYDITSWAIPYVYGLESYALQESIKAREWKIETPAPTINGPEKPYAYLGRWNSMEDARFLSSLLQEGIKVRFNKAPFKMQGEEFGRGSLLILRRGNEHMGDQFDQKVRELAGKHHRKLMATPTGYSDQFPDLGSNQVEYIKAPKIVIASGEGTSSLSFGEIWHFFEQQVNYPVSVIDVQHLNNYDLSKYDVLVLPEMYGLGNSEATSTAILDFAKNGGTLIGIGSALNLFKDVDGLSLSTYFDENEEKRMTDEDMGPQAAIKEYGESRREYISQQIVGAIYRAKVDNTHPLAYGYDKEYFSLKVRSQRYAFLKNGWNVATLGEQALVSGFAGYQANRQMDNSLVFGQESYGKGQVIYMVDNPLFRGFWENGKLFFANALFMASQP